MSTPKWKKGPEDAVRILEFISAWRPPLSWCSENGLPDCRLCWAFIHFSQVEYKRGDHTLQVSAGRGGSGMEGVHLWGEGVRTGQRVVAGIRLYGGKGVHMLIFQVSVRQTENTSKGMNYRYKIRLHLVHVSYNSRIAILQFYQSHMNISMLPQEPPCNNQSDQENMNMRFHHLR